MNLSEIRKMAGYKKLLRLSLFTVVVWLLGAVLLSNALVMNGSARRGVEDAERITYAASSVHSSSGAAAPADKEPLSAVSEIIDKTGLKPRVSQMSAGASGLAVQINDLTSEELTALIGALSDGGLSVKTAEFRALGPDGKRFIRASMTLEANGK